MRTIKNGIVQTEEQLREANTRYKFPAVSKDLNVRWCSWIAKLGVMTKAINNSKRLQNSNILVLTGERRLESAARSLYLEIEPHRSNSNTRRVVLWRPVVDWTEQQVWDIMKKHKVQPHPCYELGWGRCSCQLCIFGRENIWASINQISPEKVKRISEIEKEIGHKLYNVENKIETGEIETKGKNKGKPVMISTRDKLGIYESMVNKGNSFIKEENRLRWEKEALGEFRSPIFVDEWKLPAGAFNADDCGAN
jgi:3'-phosphoadenosine 5'-phosphosulfate sulfotransferase (PAPS reductase)/FAD synthetase